MTKKSEKKRGNQPTDSTEQTPKDNLVVKKERDKIYKKQEANMTDPEKKKKFSEQPPTKHNTRS